MSDTSTPFENTDLYRQLTVRDAANAAYQRAGSMFTASDFLEHAVFVTPTAYTDEPDLRSVFFLTIAERMRADADKRAMTDDPLNPAGAAENNGVGDVEQLRAAAAACDSIGRVYKLCGMLPSFSYPEAIAHVGSLSAIDARRFMEGVRIMLELPRSIEGYNWLEVIGALDRRQYHEPMLAWTPGEIADWSALEEHATSIIRSQLTGMTFGTDEPSASAAPAHTPEPRNTNRILADLDRRQGLERVAELLLALPRTDDGRIQWPSTHGAGKELAWLIERLYGDANPLLYTDAFRWQRLTTAFVQEDGMEIKTDSIRRQAEKLRNGSDPNIPSRIEAMFGS